MIPTNEVILNKYLEHYFSSPQSVSTRKSALNYFFKEKYFGYKGHVFDITTQLLMDYFEYLNAKSNLTITTKKLKYTILRSFLQYTMEYYHQHNFLVILPKKTIKWSISNHKESPDRVILTIDDVQKLLLYLKRTNFKQYLIFRVFVETGMRKGEHLNLTVKKCNLKKRYLDVSGKRGRKIYYISKELAHYLTIYIDERKKLDTTHDFLFISSHGNSYANRMFNRMLQGKKNPHVAGLLKKSGIDKHISVQSFRKGLNTYRKRMGCPNEDRKILLNHKTSDVNVEHYLDLNYEEFIGLYDLWNPFKNLNL